MWNFLFRNNEGNFFSSQFLLPINCSPFTYVFLGSNWQILFKYTFCFSIQFTSGSLNILLVIYLANRSANSPCNWSGNMVEFKGITNYKWESNYTRDYTSVSLTCFKKTRAELCFEIKWWISHYAFFSLSGRDFRILLLNKKCMLIYAVVIMTLNKNIQEAN